MKTSKTADKFFKLKMKKMQKQALKFLENYQNETTDAITSIFWPAIAAKANIEKILNANCLPKKSIVFCDFIAGLNNSWSSGVESLEKIVLTKDKITEEGFKNYIDELKEYFEEKKKEFDFDMGKVSCYIKNIPKDIHMNNSNTDVLKEIETSINSTLAEFTERTESYRTNIIDSSVLVTSNYQTCVATDDARKCLETLAEVRNIFVLTFLKRKYFQTQSKLLFKVSNMMDEITELITDHLLIVGPDIEDIKAKVKTYEVGIKEMIEKCKTSENTTMPENTTTK